MNKIYISILYLFLFLFINHSLFIKDNTNHSESITGLIKFVGNAPFINAVLETEEKKHYYLPDDFIKQNNKIIGKKVTLSGKTRKEVIKSADHKHQITRYYLEKIKIIKVF